MIIGDLNMIQVFLTIDSNRQQPQSLSIPKGRLKGTQKLGKNFERIDVGEGVFYLALDKSLRKIFILFRSRLKLMYSHTIWRIYYAGNMLEY